MTIEQYRANKAAERSREDSIIEMSYGLVSGLRLRPQSPIGYLAVSHSVIEICGPITIADFNNQLLHTQQELARTELCGLEGSEILPGPGTIREQTTAFLHTGDLSLDVERITLITSQGTSKLLDLITTHEQTGGQDGTDAHNVS